MALRARIVLVCAESDESDESSGRGSCVIGWTGCPTKPAKAVVLCVDEKSQIQALDRSAPMLPGVPERQSFDYVRYGTTSLFAALEIAAGQVISAVKHRHRHQEFLAFLRTALEKDIRGWIAYRGRIDDSGH